MQFEKRGSDEFLTGCINEFNGNICKRLAETADSNSAIHSHGDE